MVRVLLALFLLISIVVAVYFFIEWEKNMPKPGKVEHSLELESR